MDNTAKVRLYKCNHDAERSLNCLRPFIILESTKHLTGIVKSCMPTLTIDNLLLKAYRLKVCLIIDMKFKYNVSYIMFFSMTHISINIRLTKINGNEVVESHVLKSPAFALARSWFEQAQSPI